MMKKLGLLVMVLVLVLSTVTMAFADDRELRHGMSDIDENYTAYFDLGTNTIHVIVSEEHSSDILDAADEYGDNKLFLGFFKHVVLNKFESTVPSYLYNDLEEVEIIVYQNGIIPEAFPNTQWLVCYYY